MTHPRKPDAKTVIELSQQMGRLLAGHHPAVQGAALADLLATWLAGHSPAVREQLFALHVVKVRELIPVNARAIGTDP